MTAFIETLIPAIGWSLLHFVWQGLLIGWAAALALHALRNRSAQARYAVACGALLSCAVLPLASIVWRVLDAYATGEPAPVDPLLVAVAAVGTHAPVLLDGDGLTSFEYLLRRQLPWLVLLWASGAALMTLRLSLGLQWVRQRTLAGSYATDAAWQERLDELAQRFGLRRPIRLGVSGADLEGPMTAGCWRPIVLVPAALIAGMPPHLLEALLAHELAHIRRHDYLVNLVQSAIEILLFYHPAVWSLSKRIRCEREQVADDLAAQALGEPRRLALALSELDKFQFSTNHFAPAAHGGDLMSRIQRLIRPDTQPLTWKMAAPLLGLCAACAVLYAHAGPVDGPAQPRPAPVKAELAAPAPVADAAQIAAPPAPPAPPVPPAPPAPPALAAPAAIPAPPAPPAPPMGARANEGIHLALDDRTDGYAIVQGGSGRAASLRKADRDRLERIKQSASGDFVWFRKDGKSYIVSDPALVARAGAAWTPMEQLNEKIQARSRAMEDLGRQMGELAGQLGQQMAAAGQESSMRSLREAFERKGRELQPLGRELEALGRKLEQEDTVAGRDAVVTRMQALQRRMVPLQAQMDGMSASMASLQQARHPDQDSIRTLKARMKALDAPMGKLGKEIGELSRDQSLASQAADRSTRALLDEALRNGRATPAGAG